MHVIILAWQILSRITHQLSLWAHHSAAIKIYNCSERNILPNTPWTWFKELRFISSDASLRFCWAFDCLSVTKTSSCCFFVSRWNRAIFGRQFSMTPSTERCSSIFDLGPLTHKIYSPKFVTKSPVSRLVWQIDRRCLALLEGFRGWPIQWNHTKCCGADHCCHSNEIWARRGVQSPIVLLTPRLA